MKDLRRFTPNSKMEELLFLIAETAEHPIDSTEKKLEDTFSFDRPLSLPNLDTLCWTF